MKDVPAQVCENCGEEYVDEAITESIMKMAAHAADGKEATYSHNPTRMGCSRPMLPIHGTWHLFRAHS
jgi:hypothetical protein